MRHQSIFYCVLLLVFTGPLAGQSNHFAKDYPTYADQVATEAFFNPQGGYSVAFTGLKGIHATTVHRMDTEGNIVQSFSYRDPFHPHLNLDLDAGGNHWLVSQPLQGPGAGIAARFDSVEITYLNANLQLVWEMGFDVGLSGLEVALPTGMSVSGNHLFVVGQVYDYGLSGDVRDGIFVLKVNANGQQEWSKRFYQLDGRWAIPHHVLELENGNIAFNGSVREPFFVGDSWIWVLNANGDSLSSAFSGTNDHWAGNIVESASGRLSYFSSFLHEDLGYLFLNANLHTFNPVTQSMSQDASFQDRKGEQLLSAAGREFTLLDQGSGVTLYEFGVGATHVYHPDYEIDRHHTTSYWFNEVPPKAKSMDYNPATSNLLIGMGVRDENNAEFPVVLLTDLSGVLNIEEPEGPRNGLVYPNPSTGKPMLLWKRDGAATFLARVLDQQGRQVHAFVFNATNEMDLSSLSNGCYYLQIIQDGVTLQTEKVLIQR